MAEDWRKCSYVRLSPVKYRVAPCDMKKDSATTFLFARNVIAEKRF
jgi:hypothetical protein